MVVSVVEDRPPHDGHRSASQPDVVIRYVVAGRYGHVRGLVSQNLMADVVKKLLTPTTRKDGEAPPPERVVVVGPSGGTRRQPDLDTFENAVRCALIGDKRICEGVLPCISRGVALPDLKCHPAILVVQVRGALVVVPGHVAVARCHL